MSVDSDDNVEIPPVNLIMLFQAESKRRTYATESVVVMVAMNRKRAFLLTQSLRVDLHSPKAQD